MGFYLNPPADAFESVLRTGFYVDKTELIDYTNSVLGSDRKLTCVSRPRRFGKSFAAKMLAAYYSKGADSEALFENLRIAGFDSFREHLNKYDVLFLDIAWFISNTADIKETVSEIQCDVLDELREAFPGCIKEGTISLPKALSQISGKTERKFFVIIDEWDALFREAKDETELQRSYLWLLRGLFKGAQVSQFLVGAYMTGILPVKKYGTQSALTDFFEYTMLQSALLAKYVGFTEKEVQELCDKYSIDFEKAHKWYDGYQFDMIGHVYNPNSIIKAILNQKFSNYWTQTETYESLKIYIDMDYEGLRTAVVNMIGGGRCRIDTTTFQNDITSFKGRDDVFTLLVHLGYLAFDENRREVFIPNEEIREEFIRAVRYGKRAELVKAVEVSAQLLEATMDMDGETAAGLIEEMYNANTAPDFYNNEQVLRSIVLMAYLSSSDYYVRFQELGSGKGYIDLLFLPNDGSEKPAMILELKWNRSAKGAVEQIKDKNYAQFIKTTGCTEDILLVGINYNVRSRKHTCVIEKYEGDL